MFKMWIALLILSSQAVSAQETALESCTKKNNEYLFN